MSTRSKKLLVALVFVAACRPRTEGASEVRVANGIETSAHPEVVLLVNTNTAQLCTGTFLGARVLLTAAHCFTDPQASDLSYGNHVPIAAFHSGILGDPAALRADDVAVVVFGEDVAPASAPLGDVPVSAEAEVEMVGFGRLDAADASTTGVKRRGANRVLAVENGFIVVEGLSAPSASTAPGTDAVGARGDSGGPLFLAGRIIGVDSGGGPKAPGRKRTQYVDLQGTKARAVICRAASNGLSIQGTWPECR